MSFCFSPIRLWRQATKAPCIFRNWRIKITSDAAIKGNGQYNYYYSNNSKKHVIWPFFVHLIVECELSDEWWPLYEEIDEAVWALISSTGSGAEKKRWNKKCKMWIIPKLEKNITYRCVCTFHSPTWLKTTIYMSTHGKS